MLPDEFCGHIVINIHKGLRRILGQYDLFHGIASLAALDGSLEGILGLKRDGCRLAIPPSRER